MLSDANVILSISTSRRGHRSHDSCGSSRRVGRLDADDIQLHLRRETSGTAAGRTLHPARAGRGNPRCEAQGSKVTAAVPRRLLADIVWVPIIRFTSDRRCDAPASKSIGQDPRMVMTFCYWILRRLLELVGLRGPARAHQSDGVAGATARGRRAAPAGVPAAVPARRSGVYRRVGAAATPGTVGQPDGLAVDGAPLASCCAGPALALSAAWPGSSAGRGCGRRAHRAAGAGEPDLGLSAHPGRTRPAWRTGCGVDGVAATAARGRATGAAPRH
jgi:hypothetical protein